jgi:tRNA threonylcarbamoyladenosine biosynthesis protein TsaB
MTLTLALDTATDWASVALGDAEGMVAQVVLGRKRHAAALLPAIEHVLGVAGRTIPDVGQIVLADGPGSFTGLRIGAATVQGIVRAHHRVAVAMAPSLLATAWVGARFHPGQPVAAWYDALRGEVFAGMWRWAADTVETLMTPARLTPAAVMAAAPVTPALVVGDGAARYAAEVLAWTGRPAVGPPAGAPRAAALLVLQASGATQSIDPFAFVPDYGRPAEAQARWEAEHGRPLPDSPGHFR